MSAFPSPSASSSPGDRGTAGPISVAVVGCGAVASGHYLPALAACRGLRLEALVDANLGRAQALAARWAPPGRDGRVPALADYRELPGRVQAAVLALPNHLHAPVACELLAQGLHVLVEKPMATASADCDRMLAAAAAGGGRLAVGHQFRFFPASRMVKEVLASDLLGPLVRFELRLGVVSRWEFASDFILHRETAGGGVLADYGVHVLDLLLFWLGELRLGAYRDDARGGLESDCELELATAAGVPGFVEVSRTRNLANAFVFHGERATLEVGAWDPDAAVTLQVPGATTVLHGHARRAGEPPLSFDGSFLLSLDDFAAAIHDGRPPFVDGHEGRRAVDLIAACYAARQPLDLPWLPGGAGEAAR